MKKLLICAFVPTIFFCSTQVASANIVETPLQELSYSLDTDEPEKELSFFNDGEQVILAIEKIQSRDRISAGTYKVSKSVAGSWSASYNVKINDKEQFTAATNLSLKALKGSIISNSLTHTSSKASCSFKQKAGIITSSASVTATISSGRLVVK